MKRGRKQILREGDIVHWICSSNFIRSGELKKVEGSFAIILVPGGQRRWVPVDQVTKNKQNLNHLKRF